VIQSRDPALLASGARAATAPDSGDPAIPVVCVPPPGKDRYIRARLKVNAFRTEVKQMSGDGDKVAGKVKEAGGDLTGDKDLKAEGKKQQVAGDVKNVGENVKDKANELGEKIKD
jgi:uncharacterized protein YjbJ (UPF0337 family)